MTGKLNDKQKKKIIADYVDTQNYSETARRNNVSDVTVKDVVMKDKEALKRLEQKKEKNTQDMINYLEEKNQEKKRVIDLCLKALNDKLAKPDMFTNVKDIATVYGILIDKDLKIKELQINKENKADLSKVDELLKGIKDVAINK